MLDLFGWEVGMTWFGVLFLVLGGLILAIVPQFVGRAAGGAEWAIVAVAVIVGGWFGSEAFGTFSTWGPEIEGLFVVPAIIGGVVLGFVADVVVRAASGGRRHEPRPI